MKIEIIRREINNANNPEKFYQLKKKHKNWFINHFLKNKLFLGSDIILKNQIEPQAYL